MKARRGAILAREGWIGAAALLVFSALYPTSGSSAEERRVVEVTDLQVQARGPVAATILVTADSVLSDYESFALPDPPRLVIDLPHARHAIPQPVTVPAGSPILKIRTTQYRELPVPVVRLVFDLGRLLPYRLELAGNKMEILVSEEASGGEPRGGGAKQDGKSGKEGEPTEVERPPEPATVAGMMPPAGETAGPSAQPAAPTPGQAIEKKEEGKPLGIAESGAEPVTPEPAKAAGLTTPAVAPEAQVVELTGLQVQARGPVAATILVTADGVLSDYESFALPDPPRLVIDLPHARHAIRQPIVLPAGSPILKVRTTQYRERPVPAVRLVFDLGRVLPFRTERIENGMQIFLGEGTQEPAQPPAVAEAPKKEEVAKAQPLARRPPKSSALARRPKPEPRPQPLKEPPTMADMPAPSAPAEQIVLPAPPAPPKMPPSNGRLSLDFKGADLDDLLRLISEVSSLNIVAAYGPKDRKERDVTLRLINVEWRQALDIILRAKGLSYEQDGNVIYVGSKSEIQKAKEDRAKDIQEAERRRLEIERDAALKEEKVKEAKKKAEQEAKLREIQIEEEKRKAEENKRLFAEPLVSKEIRLNYTKAADIRKRVEPFKTVRGKLDIDESLNALIMEDVESAASKIEEAARHFDFPANEAILTKTTTLNYARATDVAKRVEPYKTSRGKVIPDEARNTLLIEDFQSAVSKMEGLVKGFDIPVDEPILTRTTALNYARAADVAKRVEPLKTPGGKLVVDEQTNSIVVEDFQSAAMKIEAFIKQLDKPEVDRFVTKLLPFNYAKAADLRTNLLALKTPQGSVVVDERSSRIIIKDLPQAVERMETFLKQIDIPTPQVLIEARIVEASRNFSQSLGVQWGGAGLATKPGSSTGVTAFGGNPSSIQFPTITGPPAGSAGSILDPTNPAPFAVPVPLALNLPATGVNPFIIGATIGSLANRYLVGAQLSAAEREGRIRTLSSPRVATQDNEEAEIKQGTQVPFTTIDSSGRTVVSFIDAFIKLKVKPHITPDGRVSMKVEAERSFPGDKIEFGGPTGGFVFPINTRKATTNILVPNGSTVIIGGLLQATEAITVDQVPFLGRIPILGWLFKRRSLGPDERVELLIFLTPSILQESRL